MSLLAYTCELINCRRVSRSLEIMQQLSPVVILILSFHLIVSLCYIFQPLIYVIFHIRTATNVKIMVFRYIAQLIWYINSKTSEIYNTSLFIFFVEDGGSRFIWNVTSYLAIYTESQPRWLCFLLFILLRVSWEASLYRGSLLGNSSVARHPAPT
jgi:hypothetical protein